MDEILSDDLRRTLGQFISVTISLLQGVAVLLGATLVARMLRGRVRRRLAATLAPENAKRMAENLVAIGVFGVALTIVLSFWGVTWTALLTAIGMSTLIVALGLQSALTSMAAGIFILLERPFNVGDYISFSGHNVEGTVEDIAFRTTVIRSEDGTRIVTPNSFIFTQAVTNHSPDRAILTIVTVHGAGGFDGTTADMGARVKAALADVPEFARAPEVTVTSRFSGKHVPQQIARQPRFGAWTEQLVQGLAEQTTHVQVSWRGRADQTALEEVVRRLKELFPQARIGVRHW
jgi:hypothetical protein